MEFQDILFEKHEPIATITLNSPKTMNALSKRLIGEMIQALEHVRTDRSLKVLIIKADGSVLIHRRTG